MGADILYLSPCCKSEEFEDHYDVINHTGEPQPTGDHVCQLCGEVFETPIREVISYEQV